MSVFSFVLCFLVYFARVGNVEVIGHVFIWKQAWTL